MNEPGFFAQLRERRVFRATLLYAALVWVALQAADLLAGAGIVSDRLVRWLILVAVIGFPVTVLASWFLDSPWREQKWLAVTGDLVIIAAIGTAAALFAWQQWFVSFSRPVVVVEPIIATDMREDSQQLADRLARQQRVLLATRPELRVPEYGSNVTDARYRIAGTLAQGDGVARLTLQVFDADGTLAWSDSFENRSQADRQLLERGLNALIGQLPLPATASAEINRLLAACKAPAELDALLSSARAQFDTLRELPPPRQPVAQQLAMQALRDADGLCPGWPETELLRLRHTRELERDDLDEDTLLRRFPNSAYIYHEIAKRRDAAGERDAARALYGEACLLQPTLALPECN